jgi:hypothetical protein
VVPVNGFLDEMRVRVSSPDGRITAELHGEYAIRVSFAPLAYQSYTEAELEAELERSAPVVYAERTRSYYTALGAAHDTTVHGERPALSIRDKEFDAARREILAQGRSHDGSVSITSRGLRSWSVSIEEGALDRLPESAFCSRLSQAVQELIVDQLAQVRALKDRVYDRTGGDR